MSTPQPRPEILQIAPYVPGESKAPGQNRVIKLSSNEGALGAPPGAQAAYQAASKEIFRYPDGASTELRQAIGARFKLDPARIVCGNGSDELLHLLCLAYGGPGAEIIMSEHGFTVYELAGQSVGSRVRKAPERNLTADVAAMLALVSPATRLVFLANPNNPTGTMLPQSEVERLRRQLPPDVLLVLDAAYAEYVEAPGYEAGAAMVDAGDNTVMTRTFSKIWGLGGMRLGWAYAPPGVIDALNRVRGPFNVSIAAQAAGVAALAEQGWLERSRAHNAEWRAWLTQALEAAGVRVWPSQGNFVLADFGSAEAATATDKALRARGVIVRPVAGYGLPQCLRITIGLEEECRLVAEIVAQHRAHG